MFGKESSPNYKFSRKIPFLYSASASVIYCQYLVIHDLVIHADADAVTPSSNTRSYILWNVPSSLGRSFLALPGALFVTVKVSENPMPQCHIINVIDTVSQQSVVFFNCFNIINATLATKKQMQ